MLAVTLRKVAPETGAPMPGDSLQMLVFDLFEVTVFVDYLFTVAELYLNFVPLRWSYYACNLFRLMGLSISGYSLSSIFHAFLAYVCWVFAKKAAVVSSILLAVMLAISGLLSLGAKLSGSSTPVGMLSVSVMKLCFNVWDFCDWAVDSFFVEMTFDILDYYWLSWPFVYLVGMSLEILYIALFYKSACLTQGFLLLDLSYLIFSSYRFLSLTKSGTSLRIAWHSFGNSIFAVFS